MPPATHFAMRTRCCLVGLLSSLAGCQREESLKPNPCLNAVSPATTFQVLNQVGSASFACDTILPGTVVLQAPAGLVDGAWRISGDPRVFTQQPLTIDFDVPGTVTIRLTARHTPNTGCFPNDTGRDTLSRRLTVLPATALAIPKTAIEGKYQGACADALSDTFTVQVKRIPNRNDPTGASQVMALFNVNKGCMSPPGTPAQVRYGYQGFSFNQDTPGFPANGCKVVAGKGYLDLVDRNKLTLEYTEQDNGLAPKVRKVFVGHRVP